MKIARVLSILIVGVFCFSAQGSPLEPQHDMDSHTGMQHSKESTDAMKGPFSHTMVVEGTRAEFQVMSLESINMKDPGGATHHIMVKAFDEKSNQPISDLSGKIKVIGPAGDEQTGDLQNYGGVLAANFKFSEKDKPYGIICIIKSGENKHLYKFWYVHK